MARAFDQPLVNRLWPGAGYQGAMMSPYLPIVQPLLQSYSALEGMLPQAAGNSLGPAQIDPTKPKGPKGGKAPGALDSLVTAGNKLGGIGTSK